MPYGAAFDWIVKPGARRVLILKEIKMWPHCVRRKRTVLQHQDQLILFRTNSIPIVATLRTNTGFNSTQNYYFKIALMRLVELSSIYEDAPMHQ